MNYRLNNALKLIEDQILDECWDVFCSGIDRIPEAC